MCKVVSNRKDIMSLQLHSFQVFISRPPNPKPQANLISYFQATLKTILFSVSFFFFDNLSVFPLQNDRGNRDKLPNYCDSSLVFFVSCRKKTGNAKEFKEILKIGGAWYLCRGPPDCRCPQTIHPSTIAGGQLCSIHTPILR